MQTCKITLSVNAGVSIRCGKFEVWVDALHNQKTPDYSIVTPELWEKMQTMDAFSRPDYLFYTHLHRDHYSAELTAEALARHPSAVLLTPENAGQAGARFRYCPLKHVGKRWGDVENLGCILDFDGFHVLVVGDCAVGNPELQDFVGETPIDLALLNFPWVTLRSGREFLERVLRPRHLMIFHLPSAADDRGGYRAAAVAGAAKISAIADVRLLLEPLQEECIVQSAT